MSETTNKRTLSFIKSNRGKDMPVLDNYIFSLNKRNCDSTFFVCTHKKLTGCPSTLTMYKNGSFKVKNEHVGHEPDPELVEMKKIRSEEKAMLQVMAENTDLPMNQIMSKVEEMLAAKDDDAAPVPARAIFTNSRRSKLKTIAKARKIEPAPARRIPSENCRVEMISLPSPAAEEGEEEGEESLSNTDKLRLSFLEEEFKYSRIRLNKFEKEFKFILAKLHIITDWISSSFDAELINKNSSVYKRWDTNSIHSQSEVERLADLIMKKKYFTNNFKSSSKSVPKTTVASSSTRRGSQQRGDANFAIEDEDDDDDEGDAAMNPGGDFGRTKNLPPRSCKREVSYIDQAQEPYYSDNEADDEDFLDPSQVLQELGVEDFDPEDLQDPPSPHHRVFIKQEPRFHEQEGQDDDDEDRLVDPQLTMNIENIINNQDLDPSLFLRTGTNPTNPTEPSANLQEVNNDNPLATGRSDYWCHFTTKRHPTTKRIVSNTCKVCGVEVSPRAYRLKEHLELRCGKPKEDRKRSQNPVAGSGRTYDDSVWSQFAWVVKGSPQDACPPSTPDEEEGEDTGPELPPMDMTSIQSIKSSNKYNLRCRRCFELVSPRLHRLRDHLRYFCCAANKEIKIPPSTASLGRKSVQEVWSKFEWRVKPGLLPGGPGGGGPKFEIKKLPKKYTNRFFQKAKKFELICKACSIVLSPRLFRLQAHLADECGKPKKRPKRSPLTGRARQKDVWDHFEWKPKGSSTSDPPPIASLSIRSRKEHNIDCHCKYCGLRVCARVVNLVQHLRVCKNYTIDESRDWFVKAPQYSQRRDWRKRGPQQCEECGKVIQGSLARHLKTHGHLKPVGCKYCSLEFRGQKAMREHILNAHQGSSRRIIEKNLNIPQLSSNTAVASLEDLSSSSSTSYGVWALPTGSQSEILATPHYHQYQTQHHQQQRGPLF